MLLVDTRKALSFPGEIELPELEYVAFSGKHETAHAMFRSIMPEKRRTFANKYILHSVVIAGIEKLRRFLSASAEELAREEKTFIDDTIRLFITSSRHANVYPRELFESLLRWSDELARLSLLQEALQNLDEAIRMGANKYPALYSRTLLQKAGILSTLGKSQQAQFLLSSFVNRPYIIPDRNLVPEMILNLGRELLLTGDPDYYKKLLFGGLRYFYMNVDHRRSFVEQLRNIYRHSYKVLLDRHVSPSDKVLFSMHWLYFRIKDIQFARVTRLSNVLKISVLGYVYCTNYLRRRSLAPAHLLHVPEEPYPVIHRPGNGSSVRKVARKKRGLLVTRAMGGIGDLLMMTPGFHALKKSRPDDEIQLAIPSRYFPIFEGNTDVTLIDIDHDNVDCDTYKKWFNLTDCPAARLESRSAPKVTRTRIDIFAQALGLNLLERWRMDKKPRYVISASEKQFQRQFWKDHGLEGMTVVGVQIQSDEVYRDYPFMEMLVHAVSRGRHVLAFDGETINGYEGQNITKVVGMPMRHAFALVSGCSAIVAPDSSFVHLAAALDVPCVGLFGPIDGKVRTKHYPKCKFLDVRHKIGCLPCWRNEQIPCKLTNMRTSICMADISIPEIQEALNEVLTRRREL